MEHGWCNGLCESCPKEPEPLGNGAVGMYHCQRCDMMLLSGTKHMTCAESDAACADAGPPPGPVAKCPHGHDTVSVPSGCENWPKLEFAVDMGGECEECEGEQLSQPYELPRPGQTVKWTGKAPGLTARVEMVADVEGEGLVVFFVRMVEGGYECMDSAPVRLWFVSTERTE